ncbi:cation diffusion facilitator family transporter [Telluribacter sp. SYSU D00476]|uniref:cation diffusion facilitator family transporter n=1 Tax=Telluribacter sp. SYSU D00476 TaxID=2811430 RepID=UPI001FF69C67|nr:cation diffusion facilitator family transporter [Telluribacter sp. SYSU D00476]
MQNERQATPSDQSLKTTLVGLLVSAGLAIVKALGGIFGNSFALIADAIESTIDVFTSAMLWLGLKWSAKPADKDHPYGHGKIEALIAVGIAMALVMASVIIARESIENILTPHQPPAPFTLGILFVVIVAKEVMYRYVLKTGVEINSEVVKADAFHHRSDAITSVAAFVGITIGIVGGEGYEVADDWAALLAAVIIVINAYIILRPAIGELLDENLDPELGIRVKDLAAQDPAVIKVEKCHIRKMGIMNYADLHIWVDKDLTVEKGHDVAHRVKAIIQKELPQFVGVMIHVEPSTRE